VGVVAWEDAVDAGVSLALADVVAVNLHPAALVAGEDGLVVVVSLVLEVLVALAAFFAFFSFWE
jgi:hypothetical protein